MLSPLLTVREAVMFSADLRLPRCVNRSQREQAVDAVIASLELTQVQGQRVGGTNSTRGVSGGERRRVYIAQELVTNPVSGDSECNPNLQSQPLPWRRLASTQRLPH